MCKIHSQLTLQRVETRQDTQSSNPRLSPRLDPEASDAVLRCYCEQVASLQAELSRVKSLLSTKESELAKMHELLAQKDDQLTAIRADFEAQSVKLAEAGSVMSQITSLSQALVDAAGGVGASLDESSVLAQTNYELFSANRALLERELELQKMQVRLRVLFGFGKTGPCQRFVEYCRETLLSQST